MIGMCVAWCTQDLFDAWDFLLIASDGLQDFRAMLLTSMPDLPASS